MIRAMREGGPTRDSGNPRQSLAEAESAAARGDWQTAQAIYAGLVANEVSPSGPLLLAWSDALKNTGAFGEALAAIERAYPAFLVSGDDLRAIPCPTTITG